MENNKEKIEKEIYKTLEQFENAEKLTPDPNFYSKVQKHLESRTKKEKPVNIILKPALLLILILFNITTIILYNNNTEYDISVKNQSELIEILSGDFNIVQPQQNMLFVK